MLDYWYFQEVLKLIKILLKEGFLQEKIRLWYGFSLYNAARMSGSLQCCVYSYIYGSYHNVFVTREIFFFHFKGFAITSTYTAKPVQGFHLIHMTKQHVLVMVANPLRNESFFHSKEEKNWNRFKIKINRITLYIKWCINRQFKDI